MHQEQHEEWIPSSLIFQLEPKDPNKIDEVEKLKREQQLRDEHHRNQQRTTEHDDVTETKGSQSHGSRKSH